METPDTGPACRHHNTHVEWKASAPPPTGISPCRGFLRRILDTGETASVAMDLQAPGTRFAAIQLLCLFALLALLFVVGGTAEAAIPLVVVVPAAIRVAMVRVWLDDDRLHVRNFWRTLDLARPDIEFFGIEDTLGGKASRRHLVFVQLRDGRTRRLSATTRYLSGAAARRHPDEFPRHGDSSEDSSQRSYWWGGGRRGTVAHRSPVGPCRRDRPVLSGGRDRRHLRRQRRAGRRAPAAPARRHLPAPLGHQTRSFKWIAWVPARKMRNEADDLCRQLQAWLQAGA